MTLATDDSIDPMQYKNQDGISRKPEVECRERFFDSQGSIEAKICRNVIAITLVADDSGIYSRIPFDSFDFVDSVDPCIFGLAQFTQLQ
jgi:hypothetical protein